MAELTVITGAFGYTGRYIARRLLAMGKEVRTLTAHPGRHHPFAEAVSVFPLAFEDPAALVRSLRGATTLYNTYWIRFPLADVTFDTAVANTRVLIGAAREAGVRRIVHVSITRADAGSRLPYFRGKGVVEDAIVRSGLSYAILRPTVIFGAEDILINNLAWLLRRFPIFALPGSGEYRLQPVFVEDVAEIAVRVAGQGENVVLDVVGPETYTFRELVLLLAETVRSRARIIGVQPGLALFLSRLVGSLVRDVILTRDELEGLMASLLVSDRSPLGRTSLRLWLAENADRVGARYASELARRGVRHALLRCRL
ncbi:MAG: NAD(P)H-binding protein [Candidatus Rokubacteria bacterium]|nr:NAD(P)H-binding protein [Candidatus Rokubacteria bacterium]